MRKGFEVEKETQHIINWIKDYFKMSGGKVAVLGVSGGKDSTIATKLFAKALGVENVFGVLMPNGTQADIDDSFKVVGDFGIKYSVIDISESYNGILDEMLANGLNINSVTTTNIPPRLRTATLYAVASTFEGGRVVCTGNASEEFVGYSTKWGDNVGDFAPLFQYTVSEVLAIGDYLGISHDLVHKAPADGLTGLTDEDNLGFTYQEVEEVMETGTCENKENYKKIMDKHCQNLHKINAINIPSPTPLFLQHIDKIPSPFEACLELL